MRQGLDHRSSPLKAPPSGRHRARTGRSSHPTRLGSVEDVLALQRLAGNAAVQRLLAGASQAVVQRKPIDVKHLGRFTAKSRDKRRNLLEKQTVNHLQRLTSLLADRLRAARGQEATAIQETLEDIPEVIEGLQQGEVSDLGRSQGNWANAVLYVDERPVANVEATKSGLAADGHKSRWGPAGKGKKLKEILISHNDSEATAFNLLTTKLSRADLQKAATSIELVFVSTNGACEGCKGRINEFIRQEVLPWAGRGVKVSMRYQYSTPPRVAQRNIPTYYGWPGDARRGNFYEHTTAYRT